MRYQWIIRLLGNPLVISDAIMEPFARGAGSCRRRTAEPDPGPVPDVGAPPGADAGATLGRACPAAGLAGRGGAIGFEIQRSLLGAVAPWLPEQAKVRLLGFYGTAIGWCQERGIACA